MKKTKIIINRIIEELEKTPVVQVVCDKVGISRNTFYKWMKQDKSFLSRVTDSLSLGNGLVNDVAISNVLEGLKNKDPMYTRYWLGHRHPDFRKPYVFKIDYDDTIHHFRSTMEGIRKKQIEDDIKNFSTAHEEEMLERASEKVKNMQDKWSDAFESKVKKEAKKLFEKWKNDGGGKKGQ